ncbi:MAG: UDP-N-acetylmuramoyl-L-alanyl-D-glutamate--2,6-diaminopimelate ligase, partial [Clostridia bacterium]|nr:UDP-N-acetylmuramoyl-L-alanyl-D-glutamate--2,6-diaminopimelate ligase [Clostridia bacterium]
MRECCQGRLIVLFGCGGDRDRGKRPQMGAIAAKYGDVAVVTSDNPRSEDPEAIIRDILAGMEDTSTVRHVETSRVEAIKWALAHAKKDDIVLLAGKGHETYQILKDRTIHLDEREIVAAALACEA